MDPTGPRQVISSHWRSPCVLEPWSQSTYGAVATHRAGKLVLQREWENGSLEQPYTPDFPHSPTFVDQALQAQLPLRASAASTDCSAEAFGIFWGTIWQHFSASASCPASFASGERVANMLLDFSTGSHTQMRLKQARNPKAASGGNVK